MHVKQFTGLVPASFEAVGIEDGVEIKGTINIKLNRLAFDVVTKEGFQDAMARADKDPQVIGELLAGKDSDDPDEVRKGLLAWWELYEDEEKTEMHPITCENIITMPFDFVAALSEAVMEKLFRQPVKAANSADGSAPAESTNSAAANSSKETLMISEGDTTSQELPDSGASPLGN